MPDLDRHAMESGPRSYLVFKVHEKVAYGAVQAARFLFDKASGYGDQVRSAS